MLKTTRWLAAVSLALMTGTASAQEQKFKISHVFPSTHWIWMEGMKVYTEAVTEASGGKFSFEGYHAGQLGKETTSVVATGLAEFGLLMPSYEAAKLPLTSVSELPGLHTTSCEGSAKLWNISKDGGALFEAEYKKLGVRPVYAVLLAPYQIMTSKKKVTNLAELSGLKIRALGAGMDKSVRLLGAVPVRVTSNEFYDALTRGTVDGGMWPVGSTKVVGLEKALSFVVVGPQLGAGSFVFAISEKAWQRLDEPTRKVVMDAGAKTQKHVCKYLDEADARVTAELVKEGLLQVTKLPDAELANWNGRVVPVADDWAKEMDATGRPGTPLLKAYREAKTQ